MVPEQVYRRWLEQIERKLRSKTPEQIAEDKRRVEEASRVFDDRDREPPDRTGT